MVKPPLPPKPPFLTGVPAIDQQHVELLTAIQDLRRAMAERRGPAALSATLDFMINYGETHFTCEEAYMRQIAYPGLAAHRTEHAYFRAQIAALDQRLRAGDGGAALDLSALLFKWLQEHILLEDASYTEFARQQARSRP